MGKNTFLGLTTLALILGSVACSPADGPDPPDAPRTTKSASPTPTPTPTATVTAADEGGQLLPALLVGSWSSVEEELDTATIGYRFTGDGRYKFVGLISYPGPEGITKITFVAEGTARTDGGDLLLRPVTATRSLEDATDPRRNYTDKPSSLDPERYVWQVNAGVLSLTAEDGNTTTYRRVPE